MVLDQLSSPRVTGLSSSTRSSCAQLLSPEDISGFSSLLYLTDRPHSCLCATAAKMCSAPSQGLQTLWPRNVTDTYYFQSKQDLLVISALNVKLCLHAKQGWEMRVQLQEIPERLPPPAVRRMQEWERWNVNSLHLAPDTCRWTNWNIPIQAATWNIPKRKCKLSLSPVKADPPSVFESRGGGWERCNTY